MICLAIRSVLSKASSQKCAVHGWKLKSRFLESSFVAEMRNRGSVGTQFRMDKSSLENQKLRLFRQSENEYHIPTVSTPLLHCYRTSHYIQTLSRLVNSPTMNTDSRTIFAVEVSDISDKVVELDDKQGPNEPRPSHPSYPSFVLAAMQ